MKILVTGGTGFVGRALLPALEAAGHEVVGLSRRANARVAGARSRFVTQLDAVPVDTFDAVVNLAGEAIADARWTPARKRLLLESRVGTTSRLVQWMGGGSRPPPVLVSASAVGYYGEQGDREVVEDTPPVPGFTHDLCVAWEREARRAEALGVRVCLMRVGIVLDRDGGALAKMLPAFRLGGGGPLAGGRAWYPWIHRADLARACQWLVETPSARGAYNASAPNPVTNAEFTRALGRALGRPAVMPMPAAALRLLFGELAELLTMSDRMVPKRLLEEGFCFRYPDLEGAFAAIFPR